MKSYVEKVIWTLSAILFGGIGSLILRLMGYRTVPRVQPISSDRIGHLLEELDEAVVRTTVVDRENDLRTKYYFTSQALIAPGPAGEARNLMMIGPRALLRPIDIWDRRILRKWSLGSDTSGLRLFHSLHGYTSDSRWYEPVLPPPDLHLLDDLGLGDGHPPLVGVFLRSQSYGEAFGKSTTEYQHSHRNTDVDSYIPVIRYLNEQGYRVVTLGSGLDQNGVSDSHKLDVVDYAGLTQRNAEMDLEVARRCAFCLGCDSGSIRLAVLMRRPIALVNVANLGGFLRGGPVAMASPKIWIDSSSGLNLSLQDVVSRGAMNATARWEWEDLGVSLKDQNSSELRVIASHMVKLHRAGVAEKVGSRDWKTKTESLTYPVTLGKGIHLRFPIGLSEFRQI